MLATAGLVALAYLVGSVPCGYLLVKALRGVDVREYGSHNIGAINVLRVGGLKLGLVTLLLDAGKAWSMVLLAVALHRTAGEIAGIAFAVLVGHAYSAWFLVRERHFAEGKSVASTLGALVALAQTHRLPWLTVAIPLSLWVIVLVTPRLVSGRWLYLSLSTITATLSIPVVVWATGGEAPWEVLAVATTALVMVRHQHNFERLLGGREPSVAQTLAASHPPPRDPPDDPSA